LINKKEIQRIKGLKFKKKRENEGLFVVEGEKATKEFFINNFKPQKIYSTKKIANIPTTVITSIEMKKISFLKTPSPILAVFETPKKNTIIKEKGIILAIDNLSDPGNMGTIIRICDWFGITTILCNLKTVDCFNPKVVQASIGSLARVNCFYIDLENYFRKTKKTIYGATLDGTSVYKTKLDNNIILLLGNESHGISPQLESFLHKKITIPRFGEIQKTESLNVANAAAILLSELHR